MLHRLGPLLLTVTLAVGCASVLGQPSRVREGHLYTTGEAQYDDYFKAVHDLQIEASSWADEKQLARKPLVDQLKLTADASDSTLVELSRQQVAKLQTKVGATKLEIRDDDVHLYTASGLKGVENDEPWLAEALESCTRGEVARGKKLKALTPRVDALLASGHELETHVPDDFRKVGSQKVNEVKQEMVVTYDVLEQISSRAKHEARGVESFVANLQRAVSIGKLDVPPPAPPASAVASATPPAAPANTAAAAGTAPTTAEPAKPAEKPAAASPKPAAKPTSVASHPAAPAKPAAASKPSGEVFNP